MRGRRQGGGLLAEVRPVRQEDAEPGGIHGDPVCCFCLPTVSHLEAGLTLAPPKQQRVEGTVGKWLATELQQPKRKTPDRGPEKSRCCSGPKGSGTACQPSSYSSCLLEQQSENKPPLHGVYLPSHLSPMAALSGLFWFLPPCFLV